MSQIPDMPQTTSDVPPGDRVKPILSVITPTYNSMRYFKETVDSVLQLGIPYEWILVDDCSSDGTVEYVQGLARSNANIVLLRNETNLCRPPKSYARGLGVARGRYVLFLDHDDTIAASAVQNAVEKLKESPGPRVAISKVAYMDAASHVYKVKTIPFARYGARISGKRLFWTLLFSPTYPLKQGAVVIDREILAEVGALFDIEFMLAASLHTDFLLLDAVGLNYRNVGSSYSSKLRLRDQECYWIRLVNTYVPGNLPGLRLFFRTYKWMLGWGKISYSCISSRRI